MLTSIKKEFSNLQHGFGALSAGATGLEEEKIKLNQISCSLRVALPTLLLLSNLAFRGQSPYIGTTLGTATLMGTVLLSDKVGNESDPAIFGLQVGVSLSLLGSSLTQLSGTGLPFYLSLVTTVANGAMLFLAKEGVGALDQKKDGMTFVFHALFPLVWAGSNWAPALSSVALPIALAGGTFFDMAVSGKVESGKGIGVMFSSLGWLALGASLVGIVTSFSAFRESSGWITPVSYSSAFTLNLGLVLGALYLVGMVGKDPAAKAARKTESK